MKDNFSNIAAAYAVFRPGYPQEIIDYIVSLAPHTEQALDMATGNGQLARKLAVYFDQVYATDISAQQIENAEKVANITYSVQPSEKTDFADKQFDLIAVAQAIHWFDFNTFNKEIYRILKNDGIFVVLGYGLLKTNPKTDAIIKNLYKEILGDYWDKERRYIDENYKTIPFPFEEIKTKAFENHYEWDYEQLLGYLGTWSAVQHYKKQNQTDPLERIRKELKTSWKESDKKVTFPLLLRVGKLQKTL